MIPTVRTMGWPVLRLAGWWFCACTIGLTTAGAAEDRAYELDCFRSAFVAAPQNDAAIPAPQYAPDREADILHIKY